MKIIKVPEIHYQISVFIDFILTSKIHWTIFEYEIINRYKYTIMLNFKINAQVCIHTLADL